MKSYKHPVALCGVGLLITAAQPTAAATIWTSPTWNVATTIPDNNDIGLSDTRTVSLIELDEIIALTLEVNLTGGWNGDLYAHLVHDSGFSVLLNRPGRSVSTPEGSPTGAMSVVFDDAAAVDIHTGIPLSGGSVSGSWQPDARTADPLLVLDSSPRSAYLSGFNGLNPNGSWTLFVADQSSGFTSTLQSWSLTITAVPEPTSALLMLLAGSGIMRRHRRPQH